MGTWGWGFVEIPRFSRANNCQALRIRNVSRCLAFEPRGKSYCCYCPWFKMGDWGRGAPYLLSSRLKFLMHFARVYYFNYRACKNLNAFRCKRLLSATHLEFVCLRVLWQLPEGWGSGNSCCCTAEGPPLQTLTIKRLVCSLKCAMIICL